jgi:hypothetical protein
MIRITLAAAFSLLISAAGAQSTGPRKATLSEDIRFCRSWAEAHERTMASLNNGGRRPPGVRWKGCVVLKKGTEVEVVDSDDMQAEIVYKKKHWFADRGL